MTDATSQDQGTKQGRPFDTLREFERRSLIHAVGLPEQSFAEGSWSGIAFSIEGAKLVVEISEISEILPIPELTQVPGAKSWVLGVANIRGNLVSVVDFRRFLSDERTPMSKSVRVLLINQEGGNVGLLVDEVIGQRHFQTDDESSEQRYSDHLVADFVRQEYDKYDDHWGRFDTDKLIHSPGFVQAAA